MKDQEFINTLLDLFEYNPKTGVVTRKISASRNTRKGDVVGSTDKYGYLVVDVNRKKYRLHRLIWAIYYKQMPDKNIYIDHINRIKNDNRIENLRLVSNQENMHNMSKKGGSSSFVGVCFEKKVNKWKASIGVNNKKKHLGHFDNEIDAANAYIKAKKELHPTCPNCWYEGINHAP